MSTKEMPPGGELDGPMGERGLIDDADTGFGASRATLERGYESGRDPDLPAKSVSFGDGSYPNYERMVFDPKTGKMVDAYAGGFLKRTPWNPNER